MKGAHLISEEFHQTFKDAPRIWQWLAVNNRVYL